MGYRLLVFVITTEWALVGTVRLINERRVVYLSVLHCVLCTQLWLQHVQHAHFVYTSHLCARHTKKSVV
jgi:hypothetical protein